MAQEKYARNVILKLIKYGERDIKDYCIEHIGNVRKLVRSNIGQVKILSFLKVSYNIFQSVLEYAYNQFAQSKQRSEIVSKLYGKSWIRLSKTESEPTLISVIEKNMDYCGETFINFI